MLLGAVGDLHFGAGADFGRAPGERLEMQAAMWQNICTGFAERGVDGVLFAGDAFHRPRPSPAEIVAFRDGLNILDNADIPVLAIDGNHDVTTASLPSALEIIEPHEGYRVSREPDAMMLADAPLVTLPWRRQGDMNGTAPEHRALAWALTQIEEARQFTLETGSGILLAHWSVSGASLPNGLGVDQLHEPVLPVEELLALGFSSIVLGHIHLPGLIGGNAGEGRPIFYVGSPWVCNWGEANSAHGYWLLETETSATEFVPVKDLPFVTIDGTQTGEEITDAVVRVKMTVAPDVAAALDLSDYRRGLYLAGAYNVTSIVLDVVKPRQARVEQMDETLGPMEALDLYLEANPEERANELRDLTRNYLEER